MNLFTYLPTAFAIIGAIMAAEAQYESGQPTPLPPIRTYIGAKHLELDIVVKPL